MIVYHGTTHRRAQRICVEGFRPKKPSRRVWFAAGRGYARMRAKVQARRAHDRPVVLTCNVDIGQLAAKLGKKRVVSKSGIIAIDGHVPITVLRSAPMTPDVPSSPAELAAWINQLLRLKPHKGVSKRHPGIDRLSRWVANRFAANPRCTVRHTELLDMARRWLPEYFDGVEVDPKTLHARRRISTIEVEVAVDVDAILPDADRGEDEALDCLLSPKPERRVRGLSILEKLEEPDLFEWCVMFLEDESPAVRVRAETAALLSMLDPAKYRGIFELALYDPNPGIRRRAEKLAAGKGYCKATYWRE